MLKDIPKEVYTECLYCNDYTKHKVLNGRLGKNFLEGIFRCECCQCTKSSTIQVPKSTRIPVVISNGSISKMDFVYLTSILDTPIITYPINNSDWIHNKFRICFQLPDDPDKGSEQETYHYEDIEVMINIIMKI